MSKHISRVIIAVVVIMIAWMLYESIKMIAPEGAAELDPDPKRIRVFEPGEFDYSVIDPEYTMQIMMIEDGSTIHIDSIYNVDDSAYYFYEFNSHMPFKVRFTNTYGIAYIIKKELMK